MLIGIAEAIAGPFHGFEADHLDSLHLRMEVRASDFSYTNFYYLDSLRMYKESDTLSLHQSVIRMRLSFKIASPLVIVADLPYLQRTYKDPNEYTRSGIGDMIVTFKYRPVTAESPLIMLFGAKLPTGNTDSLTPPPLGTGTTDLMIGTLNKKETHGFEITTDLEIWLPALTKKNENVDFSNYVRYLGTAEAPVLMNGRRIGGIVGQADVCFGEKPMEDYSVVGLIGLHYIPLEKLHIQAAVGIPITAKNRETVGVYPFISLRYDI